MIDTEFQIILLLKLIILNHQTFYFLVIILDSDIRKFTFNEVLWKYQEELLILSNQVEILWIVL